MSDRQPVSGSFRLPYLSIALQYTYVHMTLIFNNEMISNNEITSNNEIISNYKILSNNEIVSNNFK